DIAITVERPLKRVRVFKLPEMEAIDGGGLPVFEDEPDSLWQLPMGVGLYKHPRTAEIFVVLSRKSGPTNGEYLWQYQLTPTDSNLVALELLRKFGKFSGGEGEIEAILVDDAMGYIYYSDELAGIRKYYADPALGNEELALFGQEDFAEDREGIALWPTSDTSGYIIVSNQQANSFNIYDRNPEGHQHQLIKEWQLSTIETDGCDLIAQPLGAKFPRGVFVAMSEDTTFHFYALEDLP
ncbi:MAG: phytase, partial [Bacteroidota bacterium]